MAVSTGTYTASSSSYTSLNAWATPIVSALSSFGWTQSSDSGQVNLSTNTAAPLGSNVSDPYQIWTMADSLQSTMPVYLKLEFGEQYYSSNTSQGAALSLTLGTGSDGAGNLTGGGTRFQLFGSTGSGGPSDPCYFSGASNRFQAAMFATSAYAFLFSVERAKTSSGADAATYATLFASGVYDSGTNNVVNVQQTIHSTLGAIPPQGCWAAPMSSYLATNNNNAGEKALTIDGGFGGAAFPFFPYVGSFDYPALGLLSVSSTDFAAGTALSVTVYGAAHAYKVFTGMQSTYNGDGSNYPTQAGVAMRYE